MSFATEVYHVTEASNIESIQKAGLQPRIGPRASAFGELVPAIYTFSTAVACVDGIMGWLGEALPDEDIVILALDIQGLETSIEVEWECKVLEPIAPSRIRQVFSEELFVNEQNMLEQSPLYKLHEASRP